MQTFSYMPLNACTICSIEFFFQMTSKMTMQKNNFKKWVCNRQQYRQLAIVNITHKHHKFKKYMQNNAKVRGELRIYPKALEKALIPSSGSKQTYVETGSAVQKLRNSPYISWGSNVLDETRIGLRTGLKWTLNQNCAAVGAMQLRLEPMRSARPGWHHLRLDEISVSWGSSESAQSEPTTSAMSRWCQTESITSVTARVGYVTDRVGSDSRWVQIWFDAGQ